MNTLFDIEKLPERRLAVRHVIAVDSRMNIGEAICIVKRNMTMQLATKMLESKDFFWERGDKVGAISTLEYGVDCIVLTTDDYVALCRQKFKEGVLQAQGFIRMQP